MAVQERERDLDRLLTFVDAVAAIAITLLVLPLAEVGQQAPTGDVARLLREHVDDLFGFLLSFAVIAQLWLAQHHVVRSLVRQNGAVVRLLMLWTLTLVFLPFPTTLVAVGSDDVLTRVLYIGTMTASSGLLALLARVIDRNPHLRDAEGPDAVYATATTITFLLALVVSVVIPATIYYPLLLLFLTDPVVRRLRRARPVSPEGS